jgi:hypothetical protein
VAASRNSELTGNRREYAFDLVAQGDQDRDGDHGNEGENQGVLHESLALLALHPAQCALGAINNFVDHCSSPPLNKKCLEIFKNAPVSGLNNLDDSDQAILDHFPCQ